MGHHFRHNAHKAAIILVIACHLCIYMLLILYFVVVTAVLMGWAKFGVLYSFWLLYYYMFCIFLNCNTYIQIKPFDVVYLSIPNLF